MGLKILAGSEFNLVCKEPTPSIHASKQTRHSHSHITISFIFHISEALAPFESARSLVRRRLALGESYGSCRVSGNCRPATSKAKHMQAGIRLTQFRTPQLICLVPCPLKCHTRIITYGSLRYS